MSDSMSGNFVEIANKPEMDGKPFIDMIKVMCQNGGLFYDVAGVVWERLGRFQQPVAREGVIHFGLGSPDFPAFLISDKGDKYVEPIVLLWERNEKHGGFWAVR